MRTDRTGWSIAGVTVLAAAVWTVAGCEVTYRAMSGNRGPESEGRTDPSAFADAAEYSTIPACDGADPCLRVLAYNTKHRDVPIQLAAVAQAMKSDLNPLPDFILLQEVAFDRPDGRAHADTATDLAAQIGMFVRATPREGGGEGLAILSVHEFEHYEALHLSNRDKFLSGGFPRVSVMGEFNVPDVGLVRVVNVHLAHRPSVNDIRAAQLEETLDWMATRQQSVRADVVVIGGDFNIEPGWREMALMEQHASTIAGGSTYVDMNTATYTSGKVGSPHRRVDYIFAASPDRAIRGVGEGILWLNGIPTVDGLSTFSPSDHLPLLHVYAVPEN